MSVERIQKSVIPCHPTPHLSDYDRECAEFTWEKAHKLLAGLPEGKGLNMAYEAVDRHADQDTTAIIFLRKSGKNEFWSYARLKSETDHFANVLKSFELKKGDCVCTYLDRIPELYVTALGSLKNGNVFCPLFSAFGPEPVKTRLALGQARVLVTTVSLYQKRIAGIVDDLNQLSHIIVVADNEPAPPSQTISWNSALNGVSENFQIPPTSPEDPALLHFTSGTTGRPKGAMHVHEAILSHHVTGMYALDLHPNDVFWCTADPGWVTGTSYGILSPLSHGATLIVDECEFDTERWLKILKDYHVSIWYTAPTALRMMMRSGVPPIKKDELPNLRLIASVGEALNREAVLWGMETFGHPVHDNWWQTETGGIMISNFISMDIKPGSMGRPLPGIEAAIIKRLDDGGIQQISEVSTTGELALRKGWPSQFRGYLNEEERYRKCFAKDWYLTGDLARCDEDGYFWFVGRADDMIKSAGHLIGPFEVESALMGHVAVAEAAVIGLPDPLAGETVKAFVALKRNFTASAELSAKILAFARTRLGALAPRQIEIVASLPKTKSGKILRRLLKARELGLPEGDISTLEVGS